jgi:hypothetical protein
MGHLTVSYLIAGIAHAANLADGWEIVGLVRKISVSTRICRNVVPNARALASDYAEGGIEMANNNPVTKAYNVGDIQT